MKKLISLLLIFILVFSGCGQNPAEEPSEEIPSEEPSASYELSENITHPYLSIYYIRKSSDDPSEKERVMLC